MEIFTEIMKPKECNICGLKDLRETPKKIKCNYCGWFVWKDNRSSKSSRSPITSLLSSSKGASKYFNTKRKPIKELLKEYKDDR
jgi:predicted Zn-ribbon and HTH transcriptional regulator